MSSDRLTGLDSSFLHLERGPAHMHVASTTLFEGPAPELRRVPRAHRVAPAPRPPLSPEAALRPASARAGRSGSTTRASTCSYHVRHTALPSPGGEDELRTLAARVFSQRLDRSKPLWEMWLVDGVEDDRFAIVAKTHHCLVDGVSGVDITTVLFDAAADPSPGAPAPDWLPRPEPSDAQVLSEALLERATDPAEVVRGARAVFSGRAAPPARRSTRSRPPARSRAPVSARPPRRSTCRSARIGVSPGSRPSSTS